LYYGLLAPRPRRLILLIMSLTAGLQTGLYENF